MTRWPGMPFSAQMEIMRLGQQWGVRVRNLDTAYRFFRDAFDMELEGAPLERGTQRLPIFIPEMGHFQGVGVVRAAVGLLAAQVGPPWSLIRQSLLSEGERYLDQMEVAFSQPVPVRGEEQTTHSWYFDISAFYGS